MLDYKKISKKLDVDKVWFMDEPEAYVVLADVTRKQAIRAIHLFEKEECGLADDELFDGDYLRAVEFREGKHENGENYIWWGNYPPGSKFLTKGWVGSI